MINQAAARVILWGGATVGAGATLGGIDSLGQPVQIPLWIVLALTFVPTSELIDVLRSMLHRLDGKAAEPETDRQ